MTFHKIFSSFTVAFCVAVGVSASIAQEKSSKAAPKADADKGQAIASKVCAACHGNDGNSTISANPKLAGQFPEYLTKQLTNFKDAADPKAKSARKSAVMMGMSAPLSSEDIRNVAAYYAAQKLKEGNARNAESAALGRKIYRGGDVSKGLAACASCHGPSGAGIPSQYPRISGQHAEYTEAQLRAFRAGERNNDANRAMRMVAEKMSDAEIKAVADYIAGLR
jgi:cytochrome c553